MVKEEKEEDPFSSIADIIGNKEQM